MLSLIYSSIATEPFDDAALAELLRTSRAANELTGVTGLLLQRNGYFLQLLEGPDLEVRDKMSSIRKDPRHTKVSILLEEQVERRQFPDWSMAYAPSGDDDPTDVPGYRTTFEEIDSDDPAATTSAPALRALIEWFRARPARLA